MSSRFYSEHHYYDPKHNEPKPLREFELVFEVMETDAPTEIFVPRLQYRDGFYVWLSDGYATYDAPSQILYYQPAKQEPGTQHKVVIRPPQTGQENRGWKYFFNGDDSVAAGR